MVEERVVHHFHFVKVDALGGLGHPHGNGVADEVNFVAARRKLQSQLGGYDAASAVSRVAGNTDLHGVRGDFVRSRARAYEGGAGFLASAGPAASTMICF